MGEKKFDGVVEWIVAITSLTPIDIGIGEKDFEEWPGEEGKKDWAVWTAWTFLAGAFIVKVVERIVVGRKVGATRGDGRGEGNERGGGNERAAESERTGEIERIRDDRRTGENERTGENQEQQQQQQQQQEQR